MPDIAMCASKTCPKREECCRAMAEPRPDYQVYFAPPSEPCCYFSPMPKPARNQPSRTRRSRP